MKKSFLLLVASVTLSGLMAQSKKELVKQVDTLKAQVEQLKTKNSEFEKKMSESATVDLSNKVVELSYALGVNIGSNISQHFDELDAEALALGISQVLKGEETSMDVNATNQIIQEYQMKKQASMGSENKEVGEKFLAENKTKKGVVALPSGLQYEIITAGKGPKPGPTAQVTTHYHGTLLDGTVFDSSVQRGEPATFGVNQVIKGWTEALQLMPKGSKWKLFIPYDLAYGEQGTQGIEPYSTLIFEVELIEIAK